MTQPIFRPIAFSFAAPAVLLPLLVCAAPASANPPVQRAEALALEVADNWIGAANAWQQQLAQEPNDSESYRGRTLALSRAGAPYVAQQLARARPDLFDDAELYWIAHRAAALTLSFGLAQRAALSGPQRFALTDQSLAKQQAILATYPKSAPTQFDRIVALRERERLHEAVALYVATLAQHGTVPPYASIAAAQAYLTLRQPERARDILLPLVGPKQGRSESLRAEITLAYALLESGQPDPALDLLDQLLAETPTLAYRGLPGIEQPNADYLYVAVQAALLNLYADRVDIAQSRLHRLRRQAPFNSDVRLAWASLLNYRERRRAARDEIRLVVVDYPDSTEAQVSQADNALAQGDRSAAQAQLAALQATHPQQRQVLRLARSLALQQRPTVSSDLVVGSTGSGNNADTTLEVLARSAPFSCCTGNVSSGAATGDWRAIVHWSRAAGGHRQSTSVAGTTPPDSQTVRNRRGAGLHYQSASVSGSVELNRADGPSATNGVVLTLQHELSDAWQATASYDSDLNTLSAATYRAGITAAQWQTDLLWSASEAQRAGLELSGQRFSDGNHRATARLWWAQRWYSGPVWKFDTTLTRTQSAATTNAAPYFNPAAQSETSLVFKSDWTSWQRYERSVHQRAALQIARYRQSGFASARAAELRYEVVWHPDQQTAVVLGTSHGSHPYDGVSESYHNVFLNLNWIVP